MKFVLVKDLNPTRKKFIEKHFAVNEVFMNGKRFADPLWERLYKDFLYDIFEEDIEKIVDERISAGEISEDQIRNEIFANLYLRDV